MAGRAPPIRAALHADLKLVVKPRRALVRRAHNEEAQARRAPLSPPTQQDIRAWIDSWNQDPKPFVWTKTADQILESIARYCNRINESRH
jgi:hypothetical protein